MELYNVLYNEHFFFCSSVLEDCEEAFVKNPDGHPLLLYLRTEEENSLTGPIRQLLERVNAADKTAKLKVCANILREYKGNIIICDFIYD